MPGVIEAASTIDADAAVVQLRSDCTEAGADIDNCFTSVGALIDWIVNARNPKPSATNPLEVKIGAGTFNAIGLACDPDNGFTGYISFTGSGRGQTTISASNGIVVDIASCTELNFQDLRIYSYNGSGGAVKWKGGGNSNWSNIDINAQYYAWQEPLISCGATRGRHNWFGSRVVSTDVFSASKVYTANCDESWFSGSEITLDLQCNYTNPNDPVALSIQNAAEAHVYGSVVRVLSEDCNANAPLIAIRARSGGVIHSHGTGIDVLSNTANDVTALAVASGGLIHANGSSYNLQTTSGTITRIDNNGGTVKAPYLWEGGSTLPDIVSEDGADMVVEHAGGTDTHLLIYNGNCVDENDPNDGGPWIDVTTGACR